MTRITPKNMNQIKEDRNRFCNRVKKFFSRCKKKKNEEAEYNEDGIHRLRVRKSMVKDMRRMALFADVSKLQNIEDRWN